MNNYIIDEPVFLKSLTKNFEESYSKDKGNTVKQTLKQILTNLLASKSKCK